MRVSGLVSNQYLDHERMGHESPYGSLGQHPNGGPMSVETWYPLGTEVCVPSLSTELVKQGNTL
mgnify:CR=1 FL=1